VSGINTKPVKPAAAAWARVAEARLPVDAHPTTVKPNSRAFETATDEGRSLKEKVGFVVSFFM
jgi:hypothetical protein